MNEEEVRIEAHGVQWFLPIPVGKYIILCMSIIHFCANMSLCTCSVDNLSSQEVLDKLEEGQVDGTLAPQIESACVLLSYLADALHAINTTQPHSNLNIYFFYYW